MMLGMAVLALALLAMQPASADYEAGQRAWEAGRADEALAQWRAAADAGDRRAMLALGRLHVQGLGVPQSYVDAHMWFNLAASRGEMASVAERDALAERMTPGQIATAQERAMEWRPGGGRAQAPAAPATPSAASPPVAADSDAPPPRAIREAQALLGALGYRPGPPDGIWGRRTEQAYRAFLRDAGLPDAETLTPEALRALRAIAQRNAGEQEAGSETTDPAAAGRASAPTTVPRPAAMPPDALHRAAHAGDIEGLKTALVAGVDMDGRDGRGWTAMMHAVNQGWTLLVPLLLEAGAAVDMRAPDGATALFMAAVHGHTEIIGLLMKANADTSIRGPQGQTAVDVARARYGEPDAAQESGVDQAVIALLNGRTWAEAEDDAAFERADSESTLEGYERYVTDNPQGRHVAEAERRIEELTIPSAHGEQFRDCEVCPLMVVVRAGSFMMGSPALETGRDGDESPIHEVTMAKPFAVGVYEVTFGEWDACVSEGGCNGRRPYDAGWGRGTRPVIYVSWDDAQAYAGWLSEKTGKRYRLLSESEWEYVARGGTATRYWWGDSVGRGRANCNGCGSRWDDKLTAPVGSFAANGFGLHDVHGNVWEWVEDCGVRSYVRAPSDGSAWTRRGGCSWRVVRGGSWALGPWSLRSANRYGYAAGSRYGSVGFRVARTLTP